MCLRKRNLCKGLKEQVKTAWGNLAHGVNIDTFLNFVKSRFGHGLFILHFVKGEIKWRSMQNGVWHIKNACATLRCVDLEMYLFSRRVINSPTPNGHVVPDPDVLETSSLAI